MQPGDATTSALRLSVEQSAAGDPKNPFVCNICKKTYSRLDHLGRHYRSHTSEKPFVCDYCDKGFSRIDLLRRHRTNHFQSDQSVRRSILRGQRATKACDACAAAKVKCAETRPCPRCIAKHVSCEKENSLEADVGSNPTALPQAIRSQPTNSSAYPGESTSQSTEFHHAVEQLATPATGSYGESVEVVVESDLSMGDALAFDDALMGDFLRDIIYPDHNSSHNAPSQMGFLPDVLDFGFDTLLDMPPPMFDQELPSTTYTDAELNPLPPSRSGAVTPNVRKVIDIGQQAFKDSFWLWTPASGDNRSAEQTFLTISEDQIVREENDIQIPASFTVSLASRDRLLSMILGTCDPATQRHVLARFPSGKLISSILNWFLARRFDETGWWLHVPSMHVNQEHETFLAGLLSAAAVESHHPDIRKLGFAVQEAARIGVANRFEEDNRSTRDLRILQAFALQLHAGFWSGMRRKMEIAESFAYPLITMLRRSGRFRLSRTNQGDTNAQDEWRNWIREESFKRLAYHVLILDATMSMSMLTQPLLSPAEFQLELPCSPKLWTAASADEWQSLGSTSHDILLPTIRDTMANLGVLVDHQCNVDVQLSLEIVIAGLWSRVWQFRQLRATSSLDGSHSNSLPANSLHQELQHNFQYLKMRSVEWEGSISAPVALKLQLCQMHLYVSLEDIQVFGGKEGATEARRTVPQLQAWAQSREAREALYHAGQALEAATQLETGTLRGFAAVAVYHASLVLWAYGILLDPSTRSREYGPPMILGLDNDDVVHLQRFLVLGQGSPCIRDYCDFASNAAPTIPVTDPARVMNSIAALLSNGSGSDERSALPIVTNLSKLMRSLGNAAIVMKRIHS